MCKPNEQLAKLEERSHRHNARIALAKEPETADILVRGSRIG